MQSLATAALGVILSDEIRNLLYLLAAVLFYYALKAMASPRTARRGNFVGAVGMLIAIVVTLLASGMSWLWIALGLAIGAIAGGYLALTVQMTAMPQMVAMFNGFGGLASALVATATYWAVRGNLVPLSLAPLLPEPGAEAETGFVLSVALSMLIGWVTFTGSLVAFGKLQDLLPSAPITFPMQKAVNGVLLVLIVAGIVFVSIWTELWWLLIPVAVLAAVLGVFFVIPIGGADMPVVISLLNSYSGLAAAATGFVIGNSGLIIAGSLVGASGIVLTRLMCRAMNRSLLNVLFGAVGAVAAGPREQRTVKSYSAEDAALVMDSARLVIVVPGYGMAVAQAQHAIKELSDILEQRGTEVRFAIHPVAGRMPGHMNVLLAEAEVPYEKLKDLQEINPEFEQADAALVIGANDVINPAARTEKDSPIYGMPILDVDKAQTVMICKRSLSPGFAGVDNELFYSDKTMMLFGDGKATVQEIIAALKES